MSKNPNKKAVQKDEPMNGAMKFFLAGCVAGLSQTAVITAPAVQQEPDEEPDWDFLGE